MGYCIEQIRCTNFLLKKENISKALEGIRALKGQKLEWIDSNFWESKTLQEVLYNCRWSSEEHNKSKDIISLYFEGQKLGSDFIILKAIAPFVEYGEIEMQGEDGSRWLWKFSNGSVEELTARITYD